MFISSLFSQAETDISCNTLIDGRRPADCQTLLKAVNVDKRHWIAAVWHRQTPTIAYTLDSLSHKSQLALLPLRPFIALCQSLTYASSPMAMKAETATAAKTDLRLEALSVAQQNDSTSCGLLWPSFAECCALLMQISPQRLRDCAYSRSRPSRRESG